MFADSRATHTNAAGRGEGAGGGRSGQSRQHKNTRKKRHSHLSLTPPAVHTACRAVCLSVARSNKHGAAPPDLRAASTRPPHARREKGLVSPMRAQAPSAPQARRPSDRHVHLDLAVRLVPDELQVGKGALLDGRHRVGDAQLREQERLACGRQSQRGASRTVPPAQGARGCGGEARTGELLAQRGDVVVVHVRVANHVHEVAALEPRHVREQAGEQRIPAGRGRGAAAAWSGVRGAGCAEESAASEAAAAARWGRWGGRAHEAMLNGTPRPRSAERWYIWHESSPLAT